jgi:hypothetical protein
MSERTERLGGGLFLAIDMLPGEKVVLGTLATRQHALFSGALGQLYLTPRRLVWTPLRVNVWLRLVKEPQIVALTDIERCEVGEKSLMRGWPVDVWTNVSQYRYYPSAALGWLAQAMPRQSENWAAAINRATQMAKRVIA